MVPWVWLRWGGTSLADHLAFTAEGWEIILAGQWQRDKETGAAGDRGSWGPDQCMAVMVSPSTDLLGSAAQIPQFLGWSSVGMGLSAGGARSRTCVRVFPSC